MRIVVNELQCEANALCVTSAPHNFELPEDSDIARVLHDPTPEEREAVLEAVRMCPKQAITLIED